jgi:hypothetical protein
VTLLSLGTVDDLLWHWEGERQGELEQFMDRTARLGTIKPRNRAGSDDDETDKDEPDINILRSKKPRALPSEQHLGEAGDEDDLRNGRELQAKEHFRDLGVWGVIERIKKQPARKRELWPDQGGDERDWLDLHDPEVAGVLAEKYLVGFPSVPTTKNIGDDKDRKTVKELIRTALKSAARDAGRADHMFKLPTFAAEELSNPRSYEELREEWS